MAERRIIEVEYEIVPRTELDDEELQDLAAAEKARRNANAPYSNFMVGAAIRTNDGKQAAGWNVENIVFHVMHAEQNAVGDMLKTSRATGLKRVTVVGAPTDSDSANPVSPCGMCRQELAEFVLPGTNPVVVMAGIRGAVQRIALRDLLPLGFFPAKVMRKAG